MRHVQHQGVARAARGWERLNDGAGCEPVREPCGKRQRLHDPDAVQGHAAKKQAGGAPHARGQGALHGAWAVGWGLSGASAHKAQCHATTHDITTSASAAVADGGVKQTICRSFVKYSICCGGGWGARGGGGTGGRRGRHVHCTCAPSAPAFRPAHKKQATIPQPPPPTPHPPHTR
jgi:hypothetical protein